MRNYKIQKLINIVKVLTSPRRRKIRFISYRKVNIYFKEITICKVIFLLILLVLNISKLKESRVWFKVY